MAGADCCAGRQRHGGDSNRADGRQKRAHVATLAPTFKGVDGLLQDASRQAGSNRKPTPFQRQIKNFPIQAVELQSGMGVLIF